MALKGREMNWNIKICYTCPENVVRRCYHVSYNQKKTYLSVTKKRGMQVSTGLDGEKEKKRVKYELGCGNQSPLRESSKERESSDLHRSSSSSTTDDGSLEISPTKALRVAMLRSRFADIIYKANHQVGVACAGDKMAQQVFRIKAEVEFKIQIKRQRKAARVELEKIEKMAPLFDDNFQVMKDLQTLMNS